MVIDKSAEAAADPDYLLTVADVRAFEDEHGPLPDGRLAAAAHRLGRPRRTTRRRSSTSGRAPRTPGPDVECARWLAEETPIVGFGVRDGRAPTRAPRAASTRRSRSTRFLLGAGKYGVTQLANLAELPPTGALVVVAPLKLVDGTGSPARVLALVAA